MSRGSLEPPVVKFFSLVDPLRNPKAFREEPPPAHIPTGVLVSTVSPLLRMSQSQLAVLSPGAVLPSPTSKMLVGSVNCAEAGMAIMSGTTRKTVSKVRHRKGKHRLAGNIWQPSRAEIGRS